VLSFVIVTLEFEADLAGDIALSGYQSKGVAMVRIKKFPAGQTVLRRQDLPRSTVSTDVSVRVSGLSVRNM
jgi:hypothetical protein